MKYRNGKTVRIRDRVLVEKGIHGIVVCDFDAGEAIPEFSDWNPSVELVAGGTLGSGVLISTVELGLLHYPCEDDDLQPAD